MNRSGRRRIDRGQLCSLRRVENWLMVNVWDLNSDDYRAKWWKEVNRIIIFNLFDRLIDKSKLNWLMHSRRVNRTLRFAHVSLRIRLAAFFYFRVDLTIIRCKHTELTGNMVMHKAALQSAIVCDRDRLNSLTVCWPSARDGAFIPFHQSLTSSKSFQCISLASFKSNYSFGCFTLPCRTEKDITTQWKE